jgi:hypothetical protein
MKKTFLLCFMIAVVICFLMSHSSCSKKKPNEFPLIKGVFWDSPVKGLIYKTPSTQGMTNKEGEFKYFPGEDITFSVGDIELGTALAREMMTPCDLSPVSFEPGDDLSVITTKEVTNIARFIQTLDEDGNVENGITISNQTSKLIKNGDYDINFDQPENKFTKNSEVVSLLADLNAAGVFTDEGIRKLRTAPQARNHLRRTLVGIIRLFNVEIPTRDGIPLLANVFLPIETHFNKKAKFPYSPWLPSKPGPE